jgi:hypothetical protein
MALMHKTIVDCPDLTDLVFERSGFPGRPDTVHPTFELLLNSSRTLFDHLRQWYLAGVLSNVVVVFFQDKLVSIDASDATLDTLFQDLGRELIGAMQNDLHIATGFLVDTLQSRRASSQS